ncbi:MAG TPA: zinc-binding dehydrogenase, partial [Polyangiales bacterium]
SVLRSRPLEEKIALANAFTRAVLPLFAHGKLRPIVEDVLPMEEAAAAHSRMESDSLFGKLVLTW